MFCRFIEEKGFVPIKRGWPDFFCRNKNGEVIFVEVKPTKDEGLKVEQFIVNSYLSSLGAKCYLWNLQTRELSEIKRHERRPKKRVPELKF